MTEQEKERQWVWVLAIVLIIACMISLPTLNRILQADLDDYVEKGSIGYILLHDHRWIILAFLAYLIAEIQFSYPKGYFKEKFKEGIEEVKIWWQSR